MTYIKNGNTLSVYTGEALLEHLPVGNYVVKYNELTGKYYLEQSEPFKLPSKLYGNADKMSERILNTFADRKANTGVLLRGLKGSGKSLLAKTVSVNSGMPTILVNSCFNGEGFNTFIQSINQSCVIIFDEFEKVYTDKEDQNLLLSLFDGVYSTRHLFIVSVNSAKHEDFSEFLLNRPGRMYYKLDYGTLGEEFIVDYCADKLLDPSKAADIVKLSYLYDDFNFDMLQALVEEVNRYGEDPREAAKMLNFQVGTHEPRIFDAQVTYKGVTLPKTAFGGVSNYVKPLSDEMNIEIYGETTDDEYLEDVYSNARDHLKHLDMRKGLFVFEMPEKHITLTLRQKEPFDLMGAFA